MMTAAALRGPRLREIGEKAYTSQLYTGPPHLSSVGGQFSAIWPCALEGAEDAGAAWLSKPQLRGAPTPCFRSWGECGGFGKIQSQPGGLIF